MNSLKNLRFEDFNTALTVGGFLYMISLLSLIEHHGVMDHLLPEITLLRSHLTLKYHFQHAAKLVGRTQHTVIPEVYYCLPQRGRE